MNMLSTCHEQIEKHLYFGVRTKQELFYEEAIKKIKNLSSNIFLSQESVEGYKNGRIDVSNFSFPKETEFYIC
jgi:ferredoxin-NADP reductase